MNHPLSKKKILLGITGSIAAYKAAFLTRLLVKAGAEVKVLMTPAATKFITPLTLSTLSKHPVLTSVMSEDGWNNHVELGLWADAIVIAPATATTLGKMANGICDNIIVACYLSARSPVFFAPAMDLDMWAHPATQENVEKLVRHGNHLIPVDDGELASGLSGKGRMAEPENIVLFLSDFFAKQTKGPLSGEHILITSGPCREPIDPVRFIGNHSTGKMGSAIADAFASLGANVHLVAGPASVLPNYPSVNVYPVTTAEDMYSEATKRFPSCKVAILAAAVADYTPKEVANKKIKKSDDDLSIPLKRTKDIAKALGAIKQQHQITVGFALETNNEEENAKAKLKKKQFDFIVLNSMNDKGAGFGHNTNKVTFIHKDNNIQYFELKSKQAVANDIAKAVLDLLA